MSREAGFRLIEESQIDYIFLADVENEVEGRLKLPLWDMSADNHSSCRLEE